MKEGRREGGKGLGNGWLDMERKEGKGGEERKEGKPAMLDATLLPTQRNTRNTLNATLSKPPRTLKNTASNQTASGYCRRERKRKRKRKREREREKKKSYTK